MASYGHDEAQAELGFANQGRVGYAIVTLEGKLGARASYRISINPVDETASAPACGEPNYFYPNSASVFTAGPTVPCRVEGNHRVDMYKYLALDNLQQQGPVREGYVEFALPGSTSLLFGRFRLPMGFDSDDAGSFTAKDSTRIQRINAEADFGTRIRWSRTAHGRPLVTAQGAVFLGDTHRSTDYNYFYFDDPSLSSKRTLSGLVSVAGFPTRFLELRAAFKHGVTGSRVERLPSYWASKRRDDAVIVSGRFRPSQYAAAFGEWARYTWGPTATSAAFLSVDAQPIHKSGWYAGLHLSYPLPQKRAVGVVVTREDMSRDDSLVKWLAAQNLYRVVLGKRDRATITRLYIHISDEVTVGVYRNRESTPFPWISGIVPVTGPDAFAVHSTSKWGIVVTMRLD